MRTLLRVTVIAILTMFPIVVRAGGPRFVAGSGFNPGTEGTALVWLGGQISYYTDQGDLSPLLRQADADAIVADAFATWTSVPTAAVSAARAGQLDEDVSGANVTRAGAVLTMPADIQPTSAKPFAIVYDNDGKVIDALLGAGASASCDANAVVGGADRFAADAHITHALLIVNGNCARAATDLAVLRYRLVRAIGRTLGLDWSQLNDNVFAGSPGPVLDDFAGLPIMHPQGGLCSSSYGCAYNAGQLRMDDRAAISRLYPVTPVNVAQFAGKAVFASATGRVHGNVLFSDGTPMQGVNVVARYIDPSTGAPSRSVAAASVSGFLFRGDAGNAMTGFTSGTGERFDEWGSQDASLRGFYDLAGLEIPAGAGSARYQLTVEAINPAYTGALSVGPYRLSQVAPPGSSAAVVITITPGSDVIQDIVLEGAAPVFDMAEPHSFAEPASIPGAGHWAAAFSYYGDYDWHALPLAAHRSFTIDVTALSDAGSPATCKALPVLGLWAPDAAESDPPLIAQTWFNTAGATTRLQASTAAAATFKLGIADARGDGRPDFAYRARVLYAGDVSPAAATAGTVLRVTGIGFAPGMKVAVGGTSATVLSYAVDQLLVTAPALRDGVYDVTVTDAVSGATAAISNAITYGGGGASRLQLLLASNPPVPVGTQAPNPFRVRVLAADGITPVANASVKFTVATGSVVLLPCNSAICVVATDATGEADIWMLVTAAGPATITASLANGQNVSATVNGVTGSLMIAAVPPRIYVAAGGSAAVPLVARVAGNGAPLAGRAVEFQVMIGAGSLSASSVVTDAAGEARLTLTVLNLASETRVSVCVGAVPQTSCDIFYIDPVTASGGMQLLKTGGDGQYAFAGQTFAPVTVRVLDMNVPPNWFSGMAVRFATTVFRESEITPAPVGEVNSPHRPQPVAISSSEVTVYSDPWGQAAYIPQIPAEWGAVRIGIQATAAGQTVRFTLHTRAPGSLRSSERPNVPVGGRQMQQRVVRSP